LDLMTRFDQKTSISVSSKMSSAITVMSLIMSFTSAANDPVAV
jgi:hypothetical protein